MMEPIVRPFVKEVEKVPISSPQIPYISNVTGTWIREEEVLDPNYWGRHLRNTVRFADGVAELLKNPDSILLEVGPGNTLTTLAKRHPSHSVGRIVLPSIRHAHEKQADEAFILNTLGRLWLVGVQINWCGFYRHEQRKRLPLPTYPFERQRYWLEGKGFSLGEKVSQPDFGKRRDINDWLYIPSWKRADLNSTLAMLPSEKLPNNWLIFVDEEDVGFELAARLVECGRMVITVTVGDHFQKTGEYGYAVNPGRQGDYESLISSLVEHRDVPEAIVHMWGINANGQAQEDWPSFDETQERGYFSLIYLAKSLGKHHVVTPMQIAVVTTNLQEVTGEENLCPEVATVLGPCKVIPQEYQNIICRSIDISKHDLRPKHKDRLIERLMIEVVSAPSDLTVAYRGNHRWIQTFEKPSVIEPQDHPALRRGGVYLITGGLGRIGLTFAQFLAEKAEAKIVLLDQIDFPPRTNWENVLSCSTTATELRAKIQQIQAMEKAGAKVAVYSVDIADSAKMQRVVTTVARRLGRLNGVIHAAGLVGERAVRPIQEVSAEDCHSQFQAKICGLQTLANVCAEQHPDFIILQSSLSTVLGGLGLASYSAANCYLDGFARKQNLQGNVPYISLDWDGWKFNGNENGKEKIGKKLMEFAITPQEGVQVLQRILSMPPFAQVVISTGDLHQRMDQWLKHETKNEKKEIPTVSAAHARPNLQTTFVAPGSDLEKELTAKWQELLGIKDIGIYDSFFELGGNSLLGTQLLSQLRDMYRLELPIRTLFEDPTVAAVAKYIESSQEKNQTNGAMDKIAETVAQIESLSEEQVRALLQQEGQ